MDEIRKEPEWKKVVKGLITHELDITEPSLDLSVYIIGPKEVLTTFEPFINMIIASEAMKKTFPELKDIIDTEIKRHLLDLIFFQKSIIEEKEKHV